MIATEKIDGRKGNGGNRAWSGRKKGVLNKVQLDLRKAAREYTDTAWPVVLCQTAS